MESLGNKLKKERELRSFTLEDIALATNIKLTYLIAIEHDNFDDLPHDTFVRGYLRSYASFIGLNPEEVVKAYDYLFALKQSRNNQIEDEIREYSEEKKDKKGRNPVLIGGAAFFLMVVTLVYLLSGKPPVKTGKVNNDASKPETVKREVKTVKRKIKKPRKLTRKRAVKKPDIIKKKPAVLKKTAPETKKALPVKVKKKTEKPSTGKVIKPEKKETAALKPLKKIKKKKIAAVPQTAEAEAVPPSGPAAKLTGPSLSVKAKRQTWMLVTVDRKRVQHVIINEGETRVWAGKRRVLFSMGDPRAVEITVNGEKVLNFARKGKNNRKYRITGKTRAQDLL
ncbi:MAG: helix-turn-helix domain-containing protein [bacterium]